MTLKYVGRAPDSDFVIVPKGYVDTRYSQLSADSAYATAAANAQINGTAPGNTAGPLTNQAYVDAQDATLAHKAAVDAADATYLALTDLGASNKAVKLGADNFIPAAQLPLASLATDRVIGVVANPTINFTTHQVSTTTITEFAAATLAIPDPGWPYHILPFASVYGFATGAQDRMYRSGVGCYGRIALMDQNSRVWGGCACTPDTRPGYHIALPHAVAGATPTNNAAVTGARTLTMYLSLLSGNATGYQFQNTNFVFYAVIWPGI